jgi:hypothetical protein
MHRGVCVELRQQNDELRHQLEAIMAEAVQL